MSIFFTFLLTFFLAVFSPMSSASSQAPIASPEKTPKSKEGVSSKQKKKPKTATPLPALLKEVEAQYAKASTITAQFQQVTRVKAMKTEKKSSGKIWVKRPNLVRWLTQVPDENLLVGNGKKYWFYTPPFDEEEPGQVIIKEKSKVQSHLADALLAGSFSLARDMKFKEEGKNIFVLIPLKKRAAGDVQRAKIRISEKTKVIESVTLEHYSGNVSEIELSEIKLGESLDSDLFDFKIPKNTEVIEQ